MHAGSSIKYDKIRLADQTVSILHETRVNCCNGAADIREGLWKWVRAVVNVGKYTPTFAPKRPRILGSMCRQERFTTWYSIRMPSVVSRASCEVRRGSGK